jgi:hypothetical protein
VVKIVYTAVKTIYTAVYHLKPFELAVRIDFGLKFEFERYLAVTAVYRGKYRYRRVPVFSQQSVKKTLLPLGCWSSADVLYNKRKMLWGCGRGERQKTQQIHSRCYSFREKLARRFATMQCSNASQQCANYHDFKV